MFLHAVCSAFCLQMSAHKVIKHITEVLERQHGQVVCQWVDFKNTFLVFNALNDVRTKYSPDLLNNKL